MRQDWGSDAGQCFTYIHFNRLINKYDLNAIYISGPGHGALHLGGDQWGMMEEAGDWPGQQWLAFASVWYQLPAFNAADDATGITRTLTDNADVIIAGILVFLLCTFLFTPFIPGLRDLPRWIPLHRLVWKDYYKKYGRVQK